MGTAPLACKVTISPALKPSSLRTSWLCSPSAGARFAATFAPLIEPDDLVWVHDYHLIPLGQQLRQRGLKNRIGFFLHIPWPPQRLMVSLPYHQRLVRSMLGHRKQREAQILRLLGETSQSVEQMVATMYAGLDPRLTKAAGLSVLAHLIDLDARGRVSVADDIWTLAA